MLKNHLVTASAMVAICWHVGITVVRMTSSKVVCSLRLDPRLRRYLDAIADQRQLSFNSLVAMSLAEYWRFDPRRAGRGGGGNSEAPVPQESPPAPPAKAAEIVAKAGGRNAPCPCGSGQKYKRCCGRAGG